MPEILSILQHTPWWVFALFALLIWLGSQALQPRTLPIWRILITPAIFMGWGIASLVVQSMSSPILLADWSLAAVVCAVIGWTTNRLDSTELDRARRLVSLRGSAFPLIRNLLIFSAKYALGVAVAILPASHAQLALWDIAVSGASAGYFFGWVARFASVYRHVGDPSLAAQSQPISRR
jgi:hypothetical protein